MKNLERVMTFLMAVMIVLYGLPLTGASAAQGASPVDVSSENAEGETSNEVLIDSLADDSGPAMKFVQKGKVSTDGILTMTLKVRTSELGTVDRTGSSATYTGRFVSNGYLAFRIDGLSLRPITVSGKEIVDFSGRTACVGPTDEYYYTKYGWGDFLDEHTGQGHLINTKPDIYHNTNFATEIAGLTGKWATDSFYPQSSMLLVSSARFQEDGMLDCYLQFETRDNYMLEEKNFIDEDGFVDVVDICFQCYSGFDEEGVEKKASGDNVDKLLFSKSIFVPSSVAAEDEETGELLPSELDELVSQFYTTWQDPESAPMAMGAAGFSEKEEQYIPEKEGMGYPPVQTYYYGDEMPVEATTKCSVAVRPRPAEEGDPQKLEGGPEITYNNQTNKYVVEGFIMDIANTFSDTEGLVGAPDFTVPKSESTGMPRYKVPTATDEARIEAAQKEKNGWIPERYSDNASDHTPTMLKYFLYSTVTQNSETKPENDENGGLDAFLHSIEWKFVFPDQTSLGDYKYSLIDGTQKTVEIPKRDGSVDTYMVQQARYEGNGGSFQYDGKKIQVVTDAEGKTMVTPVGIMLDFNEDTPITYYSNSDEEIKATGYAPQLRISKDAADNDSYVWDVNSFDKQSIYLTAVYTGPAGGKFTPAMVYQKMRVYRENDRRADSINVDMEEMKVDGPDGAQVNGFAVPVDAGLTDVPRETNDKLMGDGIPFVFKVYDQYAYPVVDAKGSVVRALATVEPTEETLAAIKAAGKPEKVFTMSADPDGNTDEGFGYALKYVSSASANDVTPGWYKISATYESLSWEYLFYVAKEDDYFNYMRSSVNKGIEATAPEAGTGARVVTLTVPGLAADGGLGKETVDITISELANQWRDPEAANQNNAAKYDILPGLRDKNGAMDQTKIRSLFDVAYTWTDASGNTVAQVPGLDMTLVNRGRVTFNSSTANGTAIYLTVSVKQKGSLDAPKTNLFKFVFQHEASRLSEIYITNRSTAMTVPSEQEEALNQNTTLDILAQAHNQYGENYDWEQIYKDYGSTAGADYSTWKMTLTDSKGKPLTDPTITTSDAVPGSGHNNRIKITHETLPTAQDAPMRATITYGLFKYEFDIPISRKASVPTRIESAQYDRTTVYVPSRTAGTSTLMTPTIKVKDQYGEVMVPGKDCTVKWTLAGQGATNIKENSEKIHLDADSGIITVDPCAADIPYEFKVIATVYRMDGAPANLSTEINRLQIKRRDLQVDEIEVDQSQLSYPDNESETPWYDLTAKSQTQYSIGDTKDSVPSADLTWILEETTLWDGTVHKRVDHIDEATGGEVPGTIQATGNVYSDADRSLELNSGTGRLYLNTALERAKAPKQIKVTAVYRNSTTIRATQTIDISMEAPKPQSTEVWSNCYSTNMNVPEVGRQETRDLNAYVRDQNGFRMQELESSVKWTLEDIPAEAPEGSVKVERVGGKNVLSVTNDFPGGTVTLVATYIYNDPETQKPIPLRDSHSIGISRAAGTPSSINFTGIKDQAGFSVPLPGLNASGQGYEQKIYSLVYNVKDQFGVVMPGESVTLEVKSGSDPYGLIRSVESLRGRVSVTCSDAWRDSCNADTTITIVAKLVSDNSIVAEQEIILKRQEDIPAYAVPEMDKTSGSYVPSDRFPDQVLVPSPDYVNEHQNNGHNGKTFANFMAKVYSQYGTEMPGAKAEIKLAQKEPGLEVIADTNNGTGVLEIGQLTVALQAQITAVPVGVDAAKVIPMAASTINVILDRGASYVNGLALGSSSVKNDNPAEGYITRWPADAADNLPAVTPDSNGYAVVDTFSFRAQVIDQYKANLMEIDAAYHPVWTFAEEYEGVKFSDSNAKDSAGNIMGTLKADDEGNKFYEISIDVTGRALKAGETAKDIKLVAHVTYNDALWKPEDSRFSAAQSFTLKKGRSVPSFLYFENVQLNDSGEPVLNTEWYRPTLAEGGSAAYQLGALVYDQYGYLMSGVPVFARFLANELPAGYEVVPRYSEDIDPESAGKAVPVKYVVRQGPVSVAELDPTTLEVTLYSACQLTGLDFELTSESIPGQTKMIHVNIDNDGPDGQQPASVDMERDSGSKGDIILKGSSDENIFESISATVKNQFGDNYVGSAAFPVWQLLVKDKEGNYVPYQEVDEEGNPTDESSWFVNLQAEPGSQNALLVVQPKNFKQELSLRVYCELRAGAEDQPLLNISQYVDINVRSWNVSTPGAQDIYVVTYNGGEHGKLVGAKSEYVMPGQKPKAVPTVETDSGYGVVGWRTDYGDIVETPSQMEIWEDVEFTAVYNDVKAHVFLTGYDDNTVRPDRAVTRSEFVTMLVRAINNYDPSMDYSHPFRDVDPKRYYDKYIGYAFKLGIVSGDGDGNFRPNDTITRAEAARMVAEAAHIELGTTEARALTFSDVDSEKWYSGYVSALAAKGIINGYKDGTFKPQNTLTRAEGVTLLVQIMQEAPTKTEIERIREVGVSPFVDLKKTNWAYPYILRAAGAA